MSGAEAWAAVGLAANVIQIIGFTGDVVGRLKWCFDEEENAPRVVKDVMITLPILEGILEKAKRYGDLTAPKDETKAEFEKRLKPLKPTLKECEEDLVKLAATLKKVVPDTADDSKRAALKTAAMGIFKDSKLQRIGERITKYIDLINVATQMDVTQIMLAHLKEEKGVVGDQLMQLSQEIKNSNVTVQVQQVQDTLGQVVKTGGQNQAVVEELLITIMVQLQKLVRPVEPVTEAREPTENIPFPLGVKDFVPRKTIMRKMRALLLPSHIGQRKTPPTVVLKGMGGQGKTQLTIAFCTAAHDPKKNFHSIFWVDASSEASVLRSYGEIAAKFLRSRPKFGTTDELKDFVEAMLKSWHQPWLMILDNYDDVSAFRIQKYMPRAKTSHFLITSRSPASARLCETGCVVSVDGMEEDEAVDLFFRRAKVPENKQEGDALEEALKIVRRLGCHALAIDLSGTYVGDRGLPYLNEFLGEFQSAADLILDQDESQLPPLWEYRRKLATEGGDASEETALNVFTSWELSLKQVAPDTNEGKRKIHLLTLFAFLHNRTLSEKILQAQLSNPKSKEPPWYLAPYVRRGKWEHRLFVNDLVKLENMALLASWEYKGKAVTNISLHPLVKDWIKLRQPEEKQREFAVEATRMVEIFLVNRQTKVATFNMTQDEKEETLSYVEACQENLTTFFSLENGVDPDDRNADDTGVLGGGRLVEAGEIFALFFEYMGKIDEAHNLFKTVIAWREKTAVSDKDPQLLVSLSLFTEVLRLQKNFKEAKEVDEKVYNARLETLGPNHHDTLWSAHDLGWDLEALGDVDRAETLQRLAYEGRREFLSPTDPLTLQSINNLAHTLRRQGKTLEALQLMQETLRIGKEVFTTPHHSELLQFKSNLQDVLRFQGKLAEAEELARDSYQATCDEWGKGHLKAAASRGQLKDILWDRNKVDDAEAIAKENLDIMAYSPYSTTISRIDDIALLLDTLSGRQMTDGGNRREEIIAYAEEALGLVRKLPAESLDLPSTIQDLVYLATGLEVLRASEQLTKLEPTIFKHCKDVFTLSDRNSINSLVRYSSALRVEKQEAEANRACQKAIDELRKDLEQGETSDLKPSHLAALSWLAVLYKHVGNRRAAMEVYDRAFEFVTKGNFIEEADYETLYSIQGLAEDIDDQRRCQKAEVLHKAVLNTRKKRYKEHPCVDDSLYAYSWNLRLQDRLNEAEDVCKKALIIAEKFRGPHRNTMCILKRLAYLEEQLGKHEAAEGHYREVLAGFRALGTRHMTRVTEALEDLQELLMEQRKWVEARDLIQDAIDRRSNGWDQNPGHHAGLIRHLAIVTWELGDGVEGLRLYRKARKTYEQAWKLHTMPEGPQRQNLIRRINELLPGTENMEEEMRIEKEENEAAQAANEASIKQNADVETADDGQRTPTQAATPKQTIARDVKASLEQLNQQLANHTVASHAVHDGKTNQYQTSTKSNEEATASDYDAPGVSLSRQSTLGANSLPEAPDNEPSKLDDQDPRRFEEITRQLGQMNMNAA